MHSNMVRKVYFPRVALPMAAVLSHLVDFCVAAVLLVGLMLYYDVAFTSSLLFLPVLVAALILLTAGVGMFFAALNVRYRDVKFALPFVIQLWMFATPVIYPLTIVPEGYRPLFALNPLAGIIDAFRACVFASRDLDLQVLGISLATTAAVFMLGTMYFKRTERWFADVI